MLEVRAHYPWKAECTQSENNINQETFIFQNWYENEKATNFDSKVTNVTKKKIAGERMKEYSISLTKMKWIFFIRFSRNSIAKLKGSLSSDDGEPEDSA